MKKLRMLSSREGSPNGIRVQWYVEGEVYEVPEGLAAIFLREGWAEDAELPHADSLPYQPKVEVADSPKKKEFFGKRRK